MKYAFIVLMATIGFVLVTFMICDHRERMKRLEYEIMLKGLEYKMTPRKSMHTLT